jgi:hypothetical protein
MQPEYENENDEVSVPSPDEIIPTNITDEDQETEVVIEDKDGQTTAQVKEVSSDSEEHEKYSERVKKRLNKMTAQLREAERREQAALEFAKNVQGQLSVAQTHVSTLDKNYLAEYKNRVESQLSIVEANLQDAVERSDGKAVVEAQKMLSQLVSQQQDLAKAQYQRQSQPVQPQAYAQPQQPQQPQQPRRADPKAEAWAEKHEWFGSDQPMTYATFGIHNQLKEEGFDLSSDEYYDELDRRIRKEFPQKFRKQQEDTIVHAPNVAPATRGSSTSSNGRRTVKLTPSEVAIARRIGVPLEEYAKYVRR